MNKKILTLDKNPENINDDEKVDSYYSEELSRAAVGRLFDDEDESEDDGPPPIKSAFVTGFDRAPARAPDRNPTKKRELPVREARVTEERPVIKEKPVIMEEPVNRVEEDVPVRDEPPVDRQRRRETMTTRLLNGAEEIPEADRREARNRRRNPSPKPAVRVNVPNERKIRDDDPRNAPSDEPQTSDGDLDTFRRRFNSGELVSPPRNPNRPVRPGRADVRTNRMRDTTHEPEPINPLRMILMGSAIAVLLLIMILTWRLISIGGRLNDAEEALETANVTASAEAERQENLIISLQAALEQSEDERTAMAAYIGYDFRNPPED
ncbi:MAG: hypothetical protein LBI27_08100, partial [Clostridiales bacterium]|nr:hypothetical protein [Clostridiales bacterium]